MPAELLLLRFEVWLLVEGDVSGLSNNNLEKSLTDITPDWYNYVNIIGPNNSIDPICDV